MAFSSFVDVEKIVRVKKSTPAKKKLSAGDRLIQDQRGRDFCPSNNKPGIKKIMGTMEGRAIAVFAQSPGPEENEEGVELIGRSGRWFWKQMKRAGIERDMRDVQNVGMRCFPADVIEGSYESHFKTRDPLKEELHCCSLYTDKALEKLKARHVLVLGKVAAKQLFGRSLPAQKIFWSEKLRAKVYLLDHPSFFVRGYGGQTAKLKAFRETLEIVASAERNPGDDPSDQYVYRRKQDYRLVVNEEQALKAEVILRKYAGMGGRLSFDIESGWVDGKWTVLACGFSPKPGKAYTFVVSHPAQPTHAGRAVLGVVRRLLEDESIHKAAHYGCSDEDDLKEHENIVVAGFDHDTMYTEYFRNVEQKKYGLDEISQTRFPEFSGYKTIVAKDMIQASTVEVPEKLKSGTAAEQLKWLSKNKQYDITRLSLETLRLYNGADCDLTKRVELSNKTIAPQALIELYVDLSRLLRRMEDNGPLFDYSQHAKLEVVVPARAASLKKKILEKVGREFNPDSPQQLLTVMFGEMGLEYPGDGKPNTNKNTLSVMARTEPFAQWIMDYRKAKKADGTYVEGYKKCADINAGKLRTKWHGTGTATGRLSSGGDRDKSTSGVVNLQNIHGDPQMQNMLVADLEWRKFYRAALKIFKVERDKKLLGERLEAWVRENMPDLQTYLAADYGQVEVRVMAQASGDKNLKRDCMESDIHTKVGTIMTGWDAEKIRHDKYTRTRTKNVHFGILFGQSEDGTVNYVYQMSPPEERDKISEEDIRKAYRRYKKEYRKVFVFRDKQRAFAREFKYCETLFGRRRYLDVTDDFRGKGEDEDEADGGGGRGAYWGNVRVNMPIQGTAHQLMICALVNFNRKVDKYALLGIPVLEVHDALYNRVPVLRLLEAAKLQKELLERESLRTVKTDFPDIDWTVPIVTELEAGLRLGCKVELTGETTIGGFLYEWVVKCREQERAINRELAAVQV